MKSSDIRERFLGHFERNGHTVVPSLPLPFEDPNLLFVVAGMVQFVPYFVGQQAPPYPRATSIQKCIRTLDIEEVGRTTRHGTFFQMNGNFSFGDYFKAEAIQLAWDLSTNSVEDGGFGLDGEKIWATVYLDDDEAVDIWHQQIGMPLERIVRKGMDDNFWSMGIAGPSGPCSELYYDRGPDYGIEGGPAVDEDRYMEFWNLVFMQNERGPSTGPNKSDFEILGELPKKNIDTGMGMERMATLLQGVDNLYEIDQTRPVLDRAAALSGKTYGIHSGTRRDRVAPRRRAAAHHRRPRPLVADAHRRRRPSRQRRTRLRAAPPAAPRDPLDAAARLRGPGTARAAAGRTRLHGAVLPRARHRLRAHLDLRLQRGGRLPADPARRARRSSTPRSRRRSRQGRDVAVR